MSDEAKPIPPMVGAQVLYWPPGNVPITHRGDEPLAATIVRVWSDTLVNIAGYDATGNHFPKQRVFLWQGGDGRPVAEESAGGFCESKEHYAAWKKAEPERKKAAEKKAADDKAAAEKQAADAKAADEKAGEGHPNTFVHPQEPALQPA